MRKQRETINKQRSRLYFITELLVAVILAAGCSMIGMSNLLWEPNKLYPAATDLPGHLTKVLYLAQQLGEGHLPSWFPFWYNGSATVQYYVPLSYYLMVPIYWMTDNLMLTYKIFCGSMMTIGALGVWTFCYRKIGRVCGLAGIILFCLQPMLLASLYREGVIAQGPIFAIMPWFLLAVLSCAKKPSKTNFAGITVLVTLLILSHVMHAFMICFTTGLLCILFLLLRRISIKNVLIVCAGMAFAGLLTAFWSLVGVTGLETPGVPYLLPESAAYTTADIFWFIPGQDSFYYFAIEITAFSALAWLCYLIAEVFHRNKEEHKYYGLACILLTFITMLFSFGMRIPGFSYLPFAKGMVPGRILTYTAVTGAIASAYVLYMLWNCPKIKLLLRPVVLALLVWACIDLNPYQNSYPVMNSDAFDSMKTVTGKEQNLFDKGRYLWYANLDSSETLFAYLNNISICKGVNIEGTPQYRALYNDNIALPLKDNAYLLKQIAFWNVRYLLIGNEYPELIKLVREQLGFEKAECSREGVSLYVSNQASSYFMTDSRNALVISDGMQGFSIRFPNVVQGKSGNLLDYSEQELRKYKFIYIIEPSITTRTQKNKFEAMVTRLVNDGVKVMLEPALSKTFDLFEVHVESDAVKQTPVFTPTADCPYGLAAYAIKDNSNLDTVKSLYGLDRVYANFVLDNGNISCAVLGTKKVGKSEVIFAGAHLSQYLSSVYTRNSGQGSVDATVSDNSAGVAAIYSAIFSYYGVKDTYLPQIFEKVSKQSFDYNGGSFTYQSEEAKEVTVAVTYSPRWTATVDGRKLEVGQSENLITLQLPAGQHTVKLHYGVTIYGIIGYLISAAGLIVFVVVLIFWNRIMRQMEQARLRMRVYLQLEEEKAEAAMDGEQRLHEEAAAAVMDIEDAKEEQELDSEDEEIIKEETGEVKQEKKAKEINTNLPIIIQKTVNENGITIDIIELGEEEKHNNGNRVKKNAPPVPTGITRQSNNPARARIKPAAKKAVTKDSAVRPKTAQMKKTLVKRKEASLQKRIMKLRNKKSTKDIIYKKKKNGRLYLSITPEHSKKSIPGKQRQKNNHNTRR